MKSAWILLVILLALPAVADFPEPDNLPAVANFCQLDVPGVQRLRENGLVVSPQVAVTNLYDAYYGLELRGGAPMYITADAMLYLWYEAHRQAMLTVEKQYLRPQLIALVSGLLDATQRGQTPAGPARANAVTLAVTRKLLEPGWEIPGDLREPVEAEVGRVMAHTEAADYPGEDYTQYEVRGYYAASEELATYFRGAKYLGRRYFAVSAARPAGDNDLTRAVLLAAALRDAKLVALYRQIHDAREFLAGPVDSIGLDQLLNACDRVWGAGWTVDRVPDLGALRSELNTDRYPPTRINDRLTAPSDMMTLDKWVAVLGEHYLPDSELFQRTGEPAVPGRHLPSGLDVAAALGSATAAAHLGETAPEFPHVVPIAQAFGKSMQFSGVYGAWLQTLATLFDRPAGLPLFARGAAYQDKQLNTCLTSWTQLRHNYLLYGAQAYEVMGITEGAGIVEPLPKFWGAYAEMCRVLRERLVTWKGDPQVIETLQRLEDKARTFQRCAQDQLAGRDTAWAASDIHHFASFIASVYFDSPLVVADVATSGQERTVLEAGSGPFHPVAVLLEAGQGTQVAVGWVGSYYEWAEPNLGRLTDEAWKQRLESPYGQPEPPAWLAGIYAPASAEEAALSARLAALEAGLRQNEKSGRAQIEAAIAADPYGPLAPGAALILGKYLLEGKRYAEAEQVLDSAEDMYGGEARDQALQLRFQAKWYADRVVREAKEEDRLAAELAATAPQPGLTPAQEKARQDRRALALLNGAVPEEGPRPEVRPGADARLQQALRECPQSGYLPFIELALLLQPWPNLGEEPKPEQLAALARREEPRWTALGKKYAGSRMGLAAQTGAAYLAFLAGDADRALQEILPLVTARTLVPDPYPESVARFERDHWDVVSDSGPQFNPQYAAQTIFERAIPAAYYAGNLARAQELMALGEKSGVQVSPGREIGAWITLFGTGPDAAAFALWQAPWASEKGLQPSPERLGREALALAASFPKSPVAPAALMIAYYVAWPRSGEAFPELEKPLRERLAAYPDTPEFMVVQMIYLTRQGRYEEAEPIFRRLVKLVPAEAEEGPWWAEEWGPEIQDPAKVKAGREDYLASSWGRWGKLLQEAGLSQDFLRGTRWEGEIVDELAKRLPDRQVDIALTLPAGNYQEAALLRRCGVPALQAQPHDPRAMELRWRLGDSDSLLGIVAGGPATPHYAEAVAGFDSQTAAAEQESDRRAGLRSELQQYGSLAQRYRGTPAEALALAPVAQAYLNHDRPEQALQFLTTALARVSGVAPFRDRVTRLQTTAQAAIAAKRHEGTTQLWTTPLDRQIPPGEYERLFERQEAFLTLIGKHLVLAERTAEGTPEVVCLESDTGKLVWALPWAGVTSIIGAAADTVIVTTDRGSVAALEAPTGRVVWRRNLGLGQAGRVWGTVAGDAVASYWEEGLLCVLDAKSGRVRWQVDVLAAEAPPVIAQGQVIVQDHDENVQAWRLADGVKSWSWDRRTVMTAGQARVHGSYLQPTLAAVGGRVLVAVSGAGPCHLVCLRPGNGSLVWKRELEANVRLPAAGDAVGDGFLLLTGRTLALCSAGDGEPRWTIPAPESDRLCLQALPGLLVLEAGTREQIFEAGSPLRIVDLRTGALVQELKQAGERSGLAAAEDAGQLRLWVVGNNTVSAWSLEKPAD
jgi:outer membrane protein assembly factor BamB